MATTASMSWRSPTLTTSLVGPSRSSLWPPPSAAPAAYPSYTGYTFAAITPSPVSLGTWTPPATCQGQTPTLTWDVGEYSRPSILVLNQFYRTTTTESGEPATTTVGYECFPPGYRWDSDGDFHFTPGVCPFGYYEASSTITSSYTKTETEGYCCPSSYSVYSSGIGCYSNLVDHSAPIVRYTFMPASGLVNKTTVTFYDAIATGPPIAAATVMASFPSMTAPPQVIRPAILIRYGWTEPNNTSSDFSIGTFKVGALKLTTLLSIIAAVIFCLILLCAIGCYRSKRKKRRVLVLVPNQNPRPVVNTNTQWTPTPIYQNTPQNAYASPPPRYPPPVTAFNPRRPEPSTYVPPPAPPNRRSTNPPANPFARTPGPAIPRPPPAVPKPPSAPATPAPAYTFGSTGPSRVSSDTEDDNDDNAGGTEEEDALTREVFAAILADALATSEPPKPKGPSKAPPKFAVPALPPSRVPSPPAASRSPSGSGGPSKAPPKFAVPALPPSQVPSPPAASRSPPPAQPSNNPFANDIPMQNLPSPTRSPAPQSDFLSALLSPAGPSRPRFVVPIPSDAQNPAPPVAPAAAGQPARREPLANKLDLEPMTLSSSRNTRDITSAEVRECRELVQRLKDGHSSAQNGVYKAVRRMASCRDAWNAEDWARVLEIIRRLRVQYGIEIST